MNGKVALSIVVLLLAAIACSTISGAPGAIVGSGNVVSETRNVDSFTSVELAGSANVDIKLGPTQAVVVEADENIVPLIETSVSNGKFVIRNKPNVNISTSRGIQVHVVAKSLDAVTLSGSGNIRADGVSSSQFSVALPGSGDITLAGKADRLTVTLLGSGNVLCENLKSESAKVSLLGSGNVNVYAAKSLDASLLGSGNIHYAGNPAQVTKNIAGSGTITP